MPAPSLSSPHAPRSPGRRSKAAREGNRGRVGSPVSGRYGDYMSERLSRAIWPLTSFFFFLFPCKIHSFVRPEEAPILSPRPLRPPGARRARSVKDGAVAPPGGLVLVHWFLGGRSLLAGPASTSMRVR